MTSLRAQASTLPKTLARAQQALSFCLYSISHLQYLVGVLQAEAAAEEVRQIEQVRASHMCMSPGAK